MMELLPHLEKLLQAGGDLSTIALVLWFFKQDRRIYALEVFTGFKRN